MNRSDVVLKRGDQGDIRLVFNRNDRSELIGRLVRTGGAGLRSTMWNYEVEVYDLLKKETVWTRIGFAPSQVDAVNQLLEFANEEIDDEEGW